jgi:hypothetical protein
MRAIAAAGQCKPGRNQNVSAKLRRLRTVVSLGFNTVTPPDNSGEDAILAEPVGLEAPIMPSLSGIRRL